MESFFEISSEIKKLENLEISHAGLVEHEALLLVLEDQFILFHERNIGQIVTYNLGNKSSTIVDCIYIMKEDIFLIILSNSSIVTIPKNATNSSEYITSEWPIQPLKFHQLQGETIVLLCDGGWCYKLRFDSGLMSQVPSAPSSLDNSLLILSSCSVGKTIAVLYQQANDTGNKRSKKVATTIHQQSGVILIDTANIPENSWINIHSEDFDHVSIPLGSEEGNYLLTSHFPNNAISVIYPEGSSSYKWKKLSPLGETLISLELDTFFGSPLYALGTANTLSIIGSNTFSIWNAHYGVQYPQRSSVNAAFKSFKSSFLPHFQVTSDNSISLYFGTRDETVDSSKAYNLQRLFLELDASSAFQLLHSDLSDGSHSTHTSLGSLIGTLKKRPLESDFQPTQTGRTRRKSSATEDGILNRLDESKRILLMKVTSSENISVDINLRDAAESFLRCGNSVSALTKFEAVQKIWNETDWKVLEALICLKIVGLASYPALFTFMLQASKASFDIRYSLLVSFARYSIDLTELQAIKLISLVAYQGNDESEPQNEGKKRRKSSPKDITPTGPQQSLERLTCLVDALLYRRHGFNSSVLSEATCLLPLPLVAILIRILSNMMHGVCNTEEPWKLPVTSLTSSSPRQAPYGDYNDQTLNNIVTWMESLLESHYTTILLALKSSPKSDLTDALMCLLSALKDLPSSMNLAESTLGVSMHLQRLTKYQSKLLPSQQMQAKKDQQFHEIIGNENYQLEVVRFF